MCSDPECWEEREIAVEELDAIDADVCECGHGFVVISVSEVAEPVHSGSLVSLPDRHHPPSRRAA
jgi:hypothetical protein